MITAQGVNRHDLSRHFPGPGSPKARKTRVEGIFRDEQLTLHVFLCLSIAPPPGKILTSLDRTTREHGESAINFLVLGAVAPGYTIPPVWLALDHTGNSPTRTRMWVVLRLLHLLPAKRRQDLVAARESIGAERFGFLRHRGIRRIIRSRHNDLIDDLSGEGWFSTVTPEIFREIGGRVIVFGELLRVMATRSPTGEFAILATAFGVRQTWQLSRRRWTIKCAFSSFKVCGFSPERTGTTDPARLERLFGLVTLAWVSCPELGVRLSRTRRIQILKRGRQAVNIIRHGAHTAFE